MGGRARLLSIAAGLSIVGGGTAFAAGVTLTPYTGVTVYNLPSVTFGSVVDSTGPLDLTGHPTGFAPVFGVTLNVDTGTAFHLEGDASLTFLSAFDSVTAAPNGFGYYSISSPVSYDTFNTTMTLSKNTGTSTNTLTGSQTSTGVGGVVFVGQGSSNSATVGQANSVNASSLVQANASPTLAAGGEFVATDTGFIGFGLGDLSSVAGEAPFTLTNNYSDSLVEANFELHAAVDMPLGGVTFTSYVGPLFKQINQTVSIGTVFAGGGYDELAEQVSSGSQQHVVFTTSENLVGNYWGALFGADITAPLSNGMSLKLGVAAAPLYASINYHALGTVNIAPDTMSTLDLTGSTSAVLARGNAAISRPLGHGTLSLGANVEYLSQIATVVQGPAPVTLTGYSDSGSAQGGTMSAAGPFGATQSLSYTSLTAYGITAAYTVPF